MFGFFWECEEMYQRDEGVKQYTFRCLNVQCIPITWCRKFIHSFQMVVRMPSLILGTFLEHDISSSSTGKRVLF